MTPFKTASLLLSTFLLLSGSLVLGSAMVVAPLGSIKPALAGFTDFIPIPSGIYFELNGKSFYFGDYSKDPTLAFPGSKWEVKVKGEVFAHGYGETPGWVVDQAKRLFGF